MERRIDDAQSYGGRNAAMIRIGSIPANICLGIGRTIGRALGYELKVELSDHSIDLEMVKPTTDERAWDSELYRHGNVFPSGYSNPIKPKVNYNEQLENPNTIDVEEGSPDGAEDDENDESGPHVQLISSPRYRDYMRQDLVSQLLTPESHFNKIIMGIIALGVLIFVNIITVLYATGGF